MQTLCLIAYSLPLETEPLPEPMVIATIIDDPRIRRGVDVHMRLRAIAGQFGLLDYEITTTQAQLVPGHQLMLPLRF